MSKKKIKTSSVPLRFWIAYRYSQAEGVCFLIVSMISIDEAKIRDFAKDHNWDVVSAEDGEYFPV